MERIDKALASVLGSLSDKNYEQSLAFCRLWLDIGRSYSLLPPDTILCAIRECRSYILQETRDSYPIYPATLLVLRFVDDAKADRTLSPNTTSLQYRSSKWLLKEFFGYILRHRYELSGFRDRCGFRG